MLLEIILALIWVKFNQNFNYLLQKEKIMPIWNFANLCF